MDYLGKDRTFFTWNVMLSVCNDSFGVEMVCFCMCVEVLNFVQSYDLNK